MFLIRMKKKVRTYWKLFPSYNLVDVTMFHSKCEIHKENRECFVVTVCTSHLGQLSGKKKHIIFAIIKVANVLNCLN